MQGGGFTDAQFVDRDAKADVHKGRRSIEEVYFVSSALI